MLLLLNEADRKGNGYGQSGSGSECCCCSTRQIERRMIVDRAAMAVSAAAAQRDWLEMKEEKQEAAALIETR